MTRPSRRPTAPFPSLTVEMEKLRAENDELRERMSRLGEELVHLRAVLEASRALTRVWGRGAGTVHVSRIDLVEALREAIRRCDEGARADPP